MLIKNGYSGIISFGIITKIDKQEAKNDLEIIVENGYNKSMQNK